MNSKFSYEDNIQRINEILQKLQKGNIGIEESMKFYEEGTKLIMECQSFLKKSELKVIEINDQMKDVFEAE